MSKYDTIMLNGKSLMQWAIIWFTTPNDIFYRQHGFNFNPHEYPGLYQEARERVFGRTGRV